MRTRLSLLLLLSASAVGCNWNEPEPNVLVVVVDSLRADALRGSIGAVKTPNLQRLGQDGVVFRSSLTHSTDALASHVALFSGRPPNEAGLVGGSRTIEDGVPLLAEVLRAAGYRTMAVTSLAELGPRAGGGGIERGFKTFDAPEATKGVFLAPSAEETNRRVRAALDGVAPGKPWFLFAHYADPCAPYDAHGEVDVAVEVLLDGERIDTTRASERGLWERDLTLAPGRHRLTFRAARPLRLDGLSIESDHSELRPTVDVAGGQELHELRVTLENREPAAVDVAVTARIYDIGPIAELRQRYAREVEAVDRAIGALMFDLHHRGAYENTLIVITSNHGEALGEHGAVGHAGGLYDELLRVPLIIKPPASERAVLEELRDEQNALVRTMDVAPTVLDLLQLGPLAGASGYSVRWETARELVAARHPPLGSTLLAIRNERYKLIYAPDEDRFEMFDLSRDPLELDNVFAIEGHLWERWQTQLRELAREESGLEGIDLGRADTTRAGVVGY